MSMGFCFMRGGKIFQIRLAMPEDIGQLAELFEAYRKFYKQTANPKGARHFLLKRLRQNQSVVFCAFKGGKMLGFVQLYSTFSSLTMNASWILNDIFVVPEARGRRIATDLLEKAKQFVRKEGAKGLALETASDNPAQKLYERLGWKKDEEFFHYFWTA